MPDSLFTVLMATVGRKVEERLVMDEAKDDAFKTWLSPSNWETEAQLLANRSQRADGTLRWVLDLEEFKRWRLRRIQKSCGTSTQTL